MGRPAGEWQLWVLLLLMYALVVVLAPLAGSSPLGFTAPPTLQQSLLPKLAGTVFG